MSCTGIRDRSYPNTKNPNTRAPAIPRAAIPAPRSVPIKINPNLINTNPASRPNPANTGLLPTIKIKNTIPVRRSNRKKLTSHPHPNTAPVLLNPANLLNPPKPTNRRLKNLHPNPVPKAAAPRSKRKKNLPIIRPLTDRLALPVPGAIPVRSPGPGPKRNISHTNHVLTRVIQIKNIRRPRRIKKEPPPTLPLPLPPTNLPPGLNLTVPMVPHPTNRNPAPIPLINPPNLTANRLHTNLPAVHIKARREAALLHREVLPRIRVRAAVRLHPVRLQALIRKKNKA